MKESEEDNIKLDPLEINEANSNNRRAIKKIFHSVGIDIGVFKDDGVYMFNVESKDAVKQIITRRVEYAKVLNSKRDKIEPSIFNEAVENIKKVVSLNIDDVQERRTLMTNIEFATCHNQKEAREFFQELIELSPTRLLNFNDNKMLQFYYMNELCKLKIKMEDISTRMSDIREEETTKMFSAK